MKEKYVISDLALEMHKMLGLPYRDASAIVNIMLERVKAAIGRGQEVEFRKFGKFYIGTSTVQINKTYKNPEKLGKQIKVRSIKFRPAKTFKAIL